ncbi:hypothetical protein [Citrobacter koseri]|uniref:hypothetical protein n=1 Tax=Citrobacter koseri TaxID=545 RepID=UPI000DFFFB54|nr:hypothetical protein [Citrobacter koseri]STB73318.1 Uncharacterised protein [Citrobacter koseri]STT23497.1 Uncharacterised protein [Citrobacter koseri]
MGWQDYLLSAQAWRDYQSYTNTVQAVYTSKEELHPSFDTDGLLIKPLTLRFTGDASGLPPLFEQSCLKAKRQPDEAGFAVFMLIPEVMEKTDTA